MRLPFRGVGATGPILIVIDREPCGGGASDTLQEKLCAGGSEGVGNDDAREYVERSPPAG